MKADRQMLLGVRDRERAKKILRHVIMLNSRSQNVGRRGCNIDWHLTAWLVANEWESWGDQTTPLPPPLPLLIPPFTLTLLYTRYDRHVGHITPVTVCALSVLLVTSTTGDLPDCHLQPVCCLFVCTTCIQTTWTPDCLTDVCIYASTPQLFSTSMS
jgi:hypothetical protein